MSESRPDPRERPPDPAGTQPKVDPDTLHGPTQSDSQKLPAADARLALSAGASATVEPGLIGHGIAPAASAGSQPPAPLATAQGASPHTPRFQFLFGALGALSVAAIALAVMLLRAPTPAPEQPWSAWKPAQNEVDPAQQIADYVAPRYRLADGKQIVQVTGGPPALKGQPLTIGIVKSGQTPVALEGNNVLYQLCGDGADCSIEQGKPSTQRALLLGREALELALYTFRYVSGVNQVLVTIPPPPPGSTSPSKGSSLKIGDFVIPATTGDASSSPASTSSSHVASHALLFSQQDLAPALSSPLSATLSDLTPTVSQMAHWPDATAVKELTEPRLYDFTISETQQTGAVMLLEPPGIGG